MLDDTTLQLQSTTLTVLLSKVKLIVLKLLIVNV